MGRKYLISRCGIVLLALLMMTLWVPACGHELGPPRDMHESMPASVIVQVEDPAAAALTLYPRKYWVIIGEPFQITFQGDYQPSVGGVRLAPDVPDTLNILSESSQPDAANPDMPLRITKTMIAPHEGTYEISCTATAKDFDFSTTSRITIIAVASKAEAIKQAEEAEKPVPGKITPIKLAPDSRSKVQSATQPPAGYARIRGGVFTWEFANGRRYLLRGIYIIAWEASGSINIQIDTRTSGDPTTTADDDYGLTPQSWRIGNTWTKNDDAGYFDFGNVDVGSGGADIFFEIWFVYTAGGDGTGNSSDTRLEVIDGTEPTDWYVEFRTPTWHFSSGQEYLIGIDVPDLGSAGVADEAAHAYYDATMVYRYFKDCTQYNHANHKIYLNPSSSDSPFCSGSTGDITLNGMGNGYLTFEDTDSIMHEYSHSIQWGMRGGSFPPYQSGDTNHGNCSNSSSEDALVEGWARFVPCRIHEDPVYHWGSSSSSTNIDTGTWTCSTGSSDRHEWNVGAIMWDMWEDNGSSSHDYFNDMADALKWGDANTVRDYYDDFVDYFPTDECGIWQSFWERDVEYYPMHTLSVSVSPSGYGYVSKSPSPDCPTNRYDEGTVVQLTANAYSGYTFDHWSGNLFGSSNPANITMSADRTVTANFVVANNDPYTPSSPSPPDGSTNRSIYETLSWTGGDPDSGDTVTYDVYLEANDSTPDNRIVAGLSNTTYDPSPLNYSIHYYWRILSKDDKGGQTWGPIWDFWTEANSAPTTAGLGSTGGTYRPGETMQIPAHYDDTNSFRDMTQAKLLLDTSTDGSQAILGYYDAQHNKVYLHNDQNTDLIGGYAPGTDIKLSNSYGSLNLSSMQALTGGDRLTVGWAMVPKATFAGRKHTAYLKVRDRGSLMDGWDAHGWRKVNTPPTTGSVSYPSSGYAPPNTWLTIVSRYIDADDNVFRALFLMNSSLSGPNSIFLRYDPYDNKLYMRNDAGTAWIGGYAPWSPNLIMNSQGVLDCGGTSIKKVGKKLIVTWRIKPLPAFAGPKKIYLWTMDLMGATDGWNQAGQWTVGSTLAVQEEFDALPFGRQFVPEVEGPTEEELSIEGPLPWIPVEEETPPWSSSAVSGEIEENLTLEQSEQSSSLAAPQNGTVTPFGQWCLSAEDNSITATYSDADGVGNLKSASILLNTTLSGQSAIYAWYNCNTNRLYLQSDNNDFTIGGYAPGTDIRLSNNQGVLDVKNTSVSQVGNTLTVNWRIIPSSEFSGRRQWVYLRCEDDGGLLSPWQPLGWRKVDEPVNTGGITPSSSNTTAGTPVNFTTTYIDADGASNIYRAFLLINNQIVGSNAIFVRYDPVTDKLYMRNDAGTTWMGGYAPGSAHVIANSQGNLNCQYTSVAKNGELLTVTWRITPSSSFSGPKKMYLWTMDILGKTDGWNQVGQWTVGSSMMAQEEFDAMPFGEQFDPNEGIEDQ